MSEILTFFHGLGARTVFPGRITYAKTEVVIIRNESFITSWIDYQSILLSKI